jgi:hypothetical protein
VVRERERGGARGALEEEEKAVAEVDLAAAVAREERPRAAVVLGEDIGGPRVAQLLDGGGAVDQIGEERRVAGHAIAAATSGSRRQYVPARRLARAVSRPARRDGRRTR